MLSINVIQNGVQSDISQYCGDFVLKDNIKSLGREFDFSFTNNQYYDTYSSWVSLEMGDTIVVYDDNELIYQGQIIKENRTNICNYNYVCFDNAFYLNKNQTRIQFNDITVKQAIEQLCAKENIPCNVACDINTKVTKIYNGEIISKIIDDLLKLDTDETGIKYRREYNYGSLYINAFNNLKMRYDKEPLVGDFNTRRSIEKLANKVIIISGSEKQVQIVSTKTDEDSVQKYGQWTHYEKVDDKTKAKADIISERKLKELNKVQRECNVTLWGDNYVRSGRILKFNQPKIGLVGEYLVKSCEHRYTGSEHKMTCDLEMNENE